MKQSADDFQDMVENTSKAMDLLYPFFKDIEYTQRFSVTFNLLAMQLQLVDARERAEMFDVVIDGFRKLKLKSCQKDCKK